MHDDEEEAERIREELCKLTVKLLDRALLDVLTLQCPWSEYSIM